MQAPSLVPHEQQRAGINEIPFTNWRPAVLEDISEMRITAGA